MRDYKFRGKRIDNREWVEGCYAEFINYLDGNSKPGIQVIKQVPSDSDRMIPAFETELLEVIPATVGQFTGIKDKNGREIYEGDICVDARGFRFIVIWDDDNARFLGRGIGEQKEYIRYVGQEPAVEVLETIHDNPGLLGGGEPDADK